MNEYLKAVELMCVRDKDHNILGFLGVADRKIEILFIHPDALGKGIGKLLVQYVINQLDVTKVEVNEQNTQATGFYDHTGFRIISRSELDGLGNPYPILNMKLMK